MNAYFESRRNVSQVKLEFGDKVMLHVVQKSYAKETFDVYANVADIEKMLPKPYNKDELSEILE